MRLVRNPLGLAALGMLVLALTTAGTASAQITIGEVAGPGTATQLCVHGPYETIPSGPTVSRYTVPYAGVITSWSNQSTEGSGQELSFRVYRPVGQGPAYPRFEVVGTDGPRALVPSALNTFPVEIPVEAGDLIGNNNVNAETVPNACLFKTTDEADIPYFRQGSFLDGETFEAESSSTQMKRQLNVRATLLGAPTISAVSPATGPAKGGTLITITGTEFANVKGVAVGGVPVPFEVPSETSITATTTAGAAGAAASVTVTTIAGSASALTFTYEQICRVPKLKGRKLKAAKRALIKAHCRLGKVTTKAGVSAKSGKVTRSNPSQGSSRKARTKVAVKLG